MINESVALVIEAEGWGAHIDLDAINESRNDRLKRLVSLIKSHHFGIISPHRSFAHQDDKGAYANTDKSDPVIYRADQKVHKLVGSEVPFGGSINKSLLRASHNAEAWKQLKTIVSRMGFNPLVTVGAFPEKGGVTATEASIIIPGQGLGNKRLTVQDMEALNKRFNQDGFIYAGPETKGEVHLYLVSAREKNSALPRAYGDHFSIGKAEQPSDIKSLIARLHKANDDREKIEGLTQPARHGEDPGKIAHKVKFGRSKGIAITDPEQHPDKTYIP